MALSYGKKEGKSVGFQKDESKDGLVSMENDDEDKIDGAIPIASAMVQPDYPWGLRISLTEKELSKLNLDAKDASVGDYLEFRARACVKAISSHDSGDGECCRVELQIQEIGVEGG